MSKFTSTKVYGDAIGPFGFPMQSALAKLADDAMKAAPKDVRDRFKTTVNGQPIDGYVRRFVIPKSAPDFNDADQSDVSVITSEAIDHDNEVVMASGLDFNTVFQKNAVVPWCHTYDRPPVGRSMWVARAETESGKAWKAKTRYTPRPDNHPSDAEWFPSSVYHFVKMGDMPGKSIGFIPLSIREPTNGEKSMRPELEDADFLIDKALVLEYSVAPIPANPEALVESVSKMRAKGMAAGKELMDALGIIITDQPKSRETIVIDSKTEEHPTGGKPPAGTMPMCPKCMTEDHMTMRPGKAKAEKPEAGADAIHHCAKCDTDYKMDDSGDMTECMKEEPMPIESPKRFISPNTIKRAVDEKIADRKRQLAGALAEAVDDRISKMMGTV